MSVETDQISKKLIEVLTEDKHLSRVFSFTGDIKRAKLSRARLLMKNAKDNQVNVELALAAAVGIEIVHLASLIHDDVIDQSDKRRNEHSFRAVKGDKTAILYGDYLFSAAVKQIQSTQNQGCSQVFVECINNTCRGEAIQDLLLMSEDFQCSLDDLLDVARAKTGALFAFCTSAPAWIANDVADTVKEALTEIGYLLGLAYQLTDDVLDITGLEANLGKPAGNDLEKNCLTTPLFLMMQELDLNWNEFRHYYIDQQHDIKQDFLASNSFIAVKKLIAKNKIDLADQIKICQQGNWQIQTIVDFFWSLYVDQRMTLLKDIHLT